MTFGGCKRREGVSDLKAGARDCELQRGKAKKVAGKCMISPVEKMDTHGGDGWQEISLHCFII